MNTAESDFPSYKLTDEECLKHSLRELSHAKRFYISMKDRRLAAILEFGCDLLIMYVEDKSRSMNKEE